MKTTKNENQAFVLTRSKWIQSIQFFPNQAIMTTKVGKKYSISGLPQKVLEQWRYASSFGQYFDRHIKYEAVITAI